MTRRHLVDAHCSRADWRPHLTDDDGTRGATANQAGRDERRCTKPEKFHTRLISCRTAKLRFSVVAADENVLVFSGLENQSDERTSLTDAARKERIGGSR